MDADGVFRFMAITIISNVEGGAHIQAITGGDQHRFLLLNRGCLYIFLVPVERSEQRLRNNTRDLEVDHFTVSLEQCIWSR